MSPLRHGPAICAIALAMQSAGAADTIEATLRACRTESDDARRLACYDRAVAGPEREWTVAEPSAPPPPPPPPSQTAEERFGYEGALARETQDRSRQEARALKELVATVTGITTRADTTMIMTLSNGQIWRQINPDPFFRLATGDQITIRPAALGSFLMSGPSKRSTRVTRER